MFAINRRARIARVLAGGMAAALLALAAAPIAFAEAKGEGDASAAKATKVSSGFDRWKWHGQAKVLRFDIAENGARFSFDSDPLDEDGLPAYGGEFVTEGFLYPYGFLDGREGVDENGNPTFPAEVVGRWTCRGWHVGEGAKTKTGPWVITNQLFDLAERFGKRTIVTEGYEVVDLNAPIDRAITGGTGRFKNARGDSTQRMIGFNPSAGVNLRVVLRPKR